MTQKHPFLFQYLKKQHIKIDQNEFNFQIQSHPDYPSLLSISDTLNFLKINNIATRIEDVSLIESLPHDFIALFGNKKNEQFLTFVERKEDGYQYTKGEKKITASYDDFSNLFGGVVLLVEKPEKEEIKSENQNTLYISLTFFGIIYLSSIFLTGFSFPILLFVILSSLGIYLSIESISHEFGITTKFSEAVCNYTENTDCSAVINSSKSKIFDFFSFSDISITFFVAQMLGILFFSLSNTMQEFYKITFIALLLSLPVTVLSIYLQKFVAKKWCPICLAIILLLYIEIASTLFFNDINISLNITTLIYYSLALIISFILSTAFKKLIKYNFELKSKISEAIRFKRNYSLFKMALLTSQKVAKTNTDTDINFENIILGNPRSKLKIVVVISPFCGYCKEATEIVEKILALYESKIAIDIRFNFNPEGPSDEKTILIHQKLIKIYFEKGQNEFLKALSKWFLEKDISKLIHYDNADLPINEITINKMLSKQYTWNEENNTNFTPAFIINDYHLPFQYNREDIINFINDLEDDDSFNAN